MLLISSLIPLCGGAILTVSRFHSRRTRNLIVECITILTSLCVAMLIRNGAEPCTLLKLSGNYAISFAPDGAGKVLLAVIAVLWPFATLYAFEYMEHEEREDTFFGFYTMTYGVMVLLCCASNLFTLYCLYETLTLVTLPLVWHKKDHASAMAARTYVKYSIGCTAFLFAAMIIIYAYGGGTFALASTALSAMPLTAMQFVYLAGFFGFGVKATVFPMSAWLPKACAAPTPVTALLHAVAVVNAGIFAVLRLTYYVFDASVLAGGFAQYVAQIAAVCTVLYGAIMAVRERHVKHKLAYSTISNLGYMVVGITLMTPEGMAAGMLHMICHSLMKITLFFCIGAVMCKTERAYMHEIHGMAKKMPLTFGIFVIGVIALMGIPPFAGFVSKFHLLAESIAVGTVWSLLGAVSLLVSAVLTAVYGLSVLIPAYTRPLQNSEELPSGNCDPSWRMLLPLCVLVILITVIGIHPQPVIAVLRAVALPAGM